jgi:hypothetical protein
MPSSRIFTNHLDQLDGVDVVNALGGHGMVPEPRMVAGQAEHGVDAVGVGTDDVGLHGQPVAVPGDHLQQGVEPHLTNDHAGGKTRHAHHCRLVVGHVDGVDVSPEVFGLLPHGLRIGTAGGTAFGGHCQVTGTEYFFENAFGLHSAKSSLIIFLGPPPRPFRQSLAGMISS